MGLFGNIISDLSEIGSNKSKFKKQITGLSKLLSDYSFGDMPYSQELGRQKIIVAYNELIEFGQTINRNEIIKIYFIDRDVDLSIETALKVADFWSNSILEKGVQFTNSFAIRVIERMKSEEKMKISTSFESKKLKEDFPSLQLYFNEVATSIKDMYMVIDSAQQFEFRFPFITFGRTMGYNHFGIKKIDEFKFQLYYYAISENKTKRIDATSVIIKEDCTNQTYEAYFNKMMGEVFANPILQEIVTI